jgi:hypothetical protein
MSHAVTEPAMSCPNGGASLRVEPPPRYCPQCGQPTTLHPPTLLEFVHEFADHYVAIDAHGRPVTERSDPEQFRAAVADVLGTASIGL